MRPSTPWALLAASAVLASSAVVDGEALCRDRAEGGEGDAVTLLQLDSSVRGGQRHAAASGLEATAGAAAAPKAERRRERQQPTAVWRLFPGEVPGEEGFTCGPEAYVPPDPTADVAIRCAPGDTVGMWYYNVSVPELHVYAVDPNSPNFKDASVVVLPGGGNQFLAWTKEGTDIAEWLNTLGYSAFVLKYRVPQRPSLTAELIDGQRALSLVRSHASELGLNSSRVGMMGFSAGGGNTGAVSAAQERAYAPIDGVDALPWRPDFSAYIYGTGSPLGAALNPQSFIALAEDDPCVPVDVVLLFYRALTDHRVPAELHVYPSGDHGYGRCATYTESGHWEPVCDWVQDFETYLNTQVMGVLPPLPS